MNRVVVMSGISGSGKSYYIKKNFIENSKYPTMTIVSVDSYFMKNGKYTLYDDDLPKAHAKCFLDFIIALQARESLVIVDNLNLTEVDIAPYMLAAASFKYDAEIITIHANAQIAYDRIIHYNYYNVISDQYFILSSRKLRSTWKNSNIFEKEGY